MSARKALSHTPGASGGLSAHAFGRLMERVGPFEAAPHIAVAVSGGPDSLALMHLLHDWVSERHGKLEVLTVDHALRPESRAEAEQVGRWCDVLKNAHHHVLTWRPPEGLVAVQETARVHRYAMMEEKCRELGILHLALAHHQDDQAETFFLRLAAGSGPDGLCGMSGVRETGHLRLIRPLLSVPKSVLYDTCRTYQQDWFEDPSNAQKKYARGRLRGTMTALGAEGFTPSRLTQTMAQLARARNALQEDTARAAVRAVRLYPEGYAFLDVEALGRYNAEIRARVLRRLLMTVSGESYVPRTEQLDRLYELLWHKTLAFTGHTLHGCIIAPQGQGRTLICREEAAMAPPQKLIPGKSVIWDQRYHVTAFEDDLFIGKLGPGGLKQFEEQTGCKRAQHAVLSKIPPPVRPTLPVFWRGKTLVSVPFLVSAESVQPFGKIRFLPPEPLIRPPLTFD